MENKGSEHQITIMLDTRVSLEALVLNRLYQMPAIRHQEWLRGLVVQGFRLECQAIKVMQSQTPVADFQAVMQTNFSRWLAEVQTPSVSLAPPVKVLTMPTDNKPFAALKKVIG